ncbi:MAG TPA: hypothetical protein VLE50_00090 [Cellvibrio sp.]|jgi:hypothetical protein|nr:hypothetical protein [Cellvibrio sp.]
MTEKRVYQMEQPLPKDLFDPVAEKALLDHAYRIGYETFMACRHYCENPFNQNDWQRSDAWDEGWAAAENANPGSFDHSTESFSYSLPKIEGNPDCPF